MKVTGKIGLRVLCLILSLLCVAQMILPASVTAEAEENTDIFYTSRVYRTASRYSLIIGNFENGRELTVLGESGDYYKVDCYDLTGFIPKSQVALEGEKYYVNCNPESADTYVMEYVGLSDALTIRSALLQTAQSKVGCRYVYACSGPNVFDCSGYTSYVYRQNGVEISRCSTTQLENGVIISRDGLQVGDLLFFSGRRNGTNVNHVGMYAGNGQFLHADNGGVRYTSLDDAHYGDRIVCARRVINVRATQIHEVAPATAQSVLTRTANTGLR